MASLSCLRPRLNPSPLTLKPSSCLSASPSTAHFPTSLKSTTTNQSINHKPLKSTYIFNPLKPSKPTPKFRLHAQNTYEITPASDRMISIITYLLPFLNALPYGFQLFNDYPILERIFDPFVPIQAFYKSIPYVNIISFFVMYIGVVRDRKKFSRFVRRNVLQSLMLEFVMSVTPSVLMTVFSCFGELGIPLIEGTSSVIFLVFLTCFVYCFAFCILGRTPHFKYVTDLIEKRLYMEDLMS